MHRIFIWILIRIHTMPPLKSLPIVTFGLLQKNTCFFFNTTSFSMANSCFPSILRMLSCSTFICCILKLHRGLREHCISTFKARQHSKNYCIHLAGVFSLYKWQTADLIRNTWSSTPWKIAQNKSNFLGEGRTSS